jgi:hypothetical protein
LFLFTMTFSPFRSSSETSRCQFTKYNKVQLAQRH